MNKATLSLLTLFILFITGCKSNTDLPKPTTGNYQPVSQNNTWSYKQMIIGGPLSTFDHVMTGATSTFDGKKYFAADVMAMGSKSETIYFGHNDDTYSLRYITAGPWGGEAFAIEIPYLKDKAEVGTQWEASIPNSPIPGKIVVIMYDKEGNLLVLDKIYNNVMNTQARIMYDVSKKGTYSTYETIDFYVAKDIGIVQTRINKDKTTTLNYLTAYAVK